MIRSLWVGLNATLVTIMLAPIVIVAALLGIETRLYEWSGRSWCRWVLWVSGVTVRVEGLDRVDLRAPEVFMSNHQSWYDVFALSAVIPKRNRFVAKKELASIPLFGRGWKAAGHIEIDRSDRAAAIRSLNRAAELVHSDRSSIVIFPEGTRSATGELQRFKKGGFMLAMHSGVDIVPVAVVGTREIMPKGSWRIRSGEIIVRFGAPIATAGLSTRDRNELMALVRRRLNTLLGHDTTPTADLPQSDPAP